MRKETLFTLRNKMERKARNLGAGFFGTADLAIAREAISNQGGKFLAAFPFAVSVGIALSDGIVDWLPEHKEITIAKTYQALFQTVNSSLDHIALHLSQMLNENGFRTLLIPATGQLASDKIYGLFSHKLAAHMAGLGWIGPSCLLITPEWGPRVRWVTVLTNAPLEGAKPIANQCGDCRLCVESCPPKAFTGREFDPGEPREMRFDVHACIAYRNKLEKSTGVRVCGMCVHVCPFGRNKSTL